MHEHHPIRPINPTMSYPAPNHHQAPPPPPQQQQPPPPPPHQMQGGDMPPQQPPPPPQQQPQQSQQPPPPTHHHHPNQPPPPPPQQQQQQQPQQQPHQQQQFQQQGASKRRLVDRVCPPKAHEIAPEMKCYQEMLDFERKLDFNISRKTLDIQESMKRPSRLKKTLRVSITNLYYRQQETGAPAWEVRIEGGLTEDTTLPKRKFSSFFKSLVIELDSAIYGPDNHLVEWHRTATTAETDGFQVRRAGDLPVKCTILLQLNNTPPHFKINEKLARLVGKPTDTRQSVIFALWQYIKNNALQDPVDREYINNDDYLSKTFECKRMRFSEIPTKLDRLLTPPDPIVINHSLVRGNEQSQRAIFHFDVEVEDTLDTRMLNQDNPEIRQLDERVFGIVADIKRSVSSYEFFSDFSKDPQQSINKWLASQSSDLKIMTDQIGDAEEERKADYYYQPWMEEAVCRYFYRKVQERRNELEMALSSMRR